MSFDFKKFVSHWKKTHEKLLVHLSRTDLTGFLGSDFGHWNPRNSIFRHRRTLEELFSDSTIKQRKTTTFWRIFSSKRLFHFYSSNRTYQLYKIAENHALYSNTFKKRLWQEAANAGWGHPEWGLFFGTGQWIPVLGLAPASWEVAPAGSVVFVLHLQHWAVAPRLRPCLGLLRGCPGRPRGLDSSFFFVNWKWKPWKISQNM